MSANWRHVANAFESPPHEISDSKYSNSASEQQYHQHYQSPTSPDNASAGIMSSSTANGVIIGLLSSFGSAIFIAIIFLIVYFFKYTSGGRILLDRIGRPGEFDDEQAFLKEEAEALETMDEGAKLDYLRAKAWIEQNPPDSLPTDISLSQYLAIQEKGVSAWEFEPELEIANCFVEARTEIEFFDSECCVLSNLPVPKQNEVYYWESKIYDKPETTMISIGMCTKPYPLFRLPGYHKISVAYTSPGNRRYNQPFMPTPYGPSYVQGDVIGCGYRPRTGTVFFTRNGKKLEDVAHGLKSQNLFPVVGANGPCSVHVNFGQSGFVFLEANVKKWGLAPMTGSLAPPPPYGSEQGSILLEMGGGPSTEVTGNTSRHGRTRSGNFLRGPMGPTSPGPQRNPTDISLAHLPSHDGEGEGSSNQAQDYLSVRRYGMQGPPHQYPYQLREAARNASQSGSQQQHGTTEDHTHGPPPEYSSPPQSRRGSDSSQEGGESRRLLSGPSASGRRTPNSPPIPTYSQALREGSSSASHQRDGERSRSGTV